MKAVLLDTQEFVEVISAGAGKNIVSVCIFFCNISDTPSYIDVFICPQGKNPPQYDSNGNLTQGDEDTYVIKQMKIEPSDTFTLNLEKILLHPGDRIVARNTTSGTKVSVVVSYEEY